MSRVHYVAGNVDLDIDQVIFVSEIFDGDSGFAFRVGFRDFPEGVQVIFKSEEQAIEERRKLVKAFREYYAMFGG